MILIFLLLAIAPSAYATELSLTNDSYEAAEHAPSYFRFIGHSRKLGIIGTSFTGYAKQAKVSFERKAGQLVGVQVAIPANSIDTDNQSRNEKMWSTCLEVEKYPEILVRINEPIILAPGTQVVSATMGVHGAEIPLTIQLAKAEGSEFRGRTSFRLSAAGIPDPSIAIASVKDEFEIEFQVDVRD